MSDAVAATAARIRKLINLAEDQAGTPEGESAALQARRLIERSGLDQSQIDAVDLDPEPVQREVIIAVSPRPWALLLGQAVCEYFECFATNMVSDPAVQVWYGRASRLILARNLFDLLQGEIERRAKRFLRTTTGDRQRGQRFRATAADWLKFRLREMMRSEKAADGQAFGLVVARRDEARAVALKGCIVRDRPIYLPGYCAAGARAGQSIQIVRGVDQEGSGLGLPGCPG